MCVTTMKRKEESNNILILSTIHDENSQYFCWKIMIYYTIIDKNRFDDFNHLKEEIVRTIGT